MIAKESPTTETEAVPSHTCLFSQFPVESMHHFPTIRRFRD